MIRSVVYVVIILASIGAGLSLVGCPDSPTPCPVCPSCPDCSPAKPQEVEQSPATPEPTIDLLAMPAACRRANIASKGLGCCTFRSAEWAAHWQHVPALYGLPEWMKSKGIEGGGTPRKQAKMVEMIAQERGQPTPQFVQYEGSDPAIIELALKTGRVPCITWGGNHMLVAVHLDDRLGAILDNNAPERVQWMSRQQFLTRWTMGSGGWVFVLLAAPPPPPPVGAKIQECKYPDCKCGCEGKGGPRCKCKVINVPMRPAPKVEPKVEPKTPSNPIEPMGPRIVTGSIQWTYEGVEQYMMGDTIVTRKEVEDALVDDSTKLHLTLIGSASERDAALAQLGDVGRYLVQGYDPDHWALGQGHVRTAKVYLQDRAGKVLLRRDDWTDLVSCLRRSDPNYRPDADPNGKPKPIAPGLPSFDGLTAYLPWVLGGIAVVVLFAAMQTRPTPTPAPVPSPTPTPPQPAPAAPAQNYQQSLSPLDQAALELGRRALADAARRPPQNPTP